MAADEDNMPRRIGSRAAFGRLPSAEGAYEAPASPSPWGRQLLGALAASIVLGGVSGYVYGGRTGVSEGPSAGARPAIAAGADLSPARDAETQRLTNELRGLRAQVEQLRHGAEAQRAAVEEAGALAAQLREMSARLERLERASADKTPVGAIWAPATIAAKAQKSKLLSH